MRSDLTREQTKPSAIAYSVDIVSLSKKFRRNTIAKGAYTTLKSSLLSAFMGKATREVSFTHVLKNLTLRIPKGASVGVIGRNGSGKSTFLKLITGIYKPDTGTVSVNGRVAALIELGAGFHPDFTGRENLYLGGVMHGLSRKEIDARFDDIVHFAELEGVIDDPVRTYSSGMFMRLGFSLAVHTNPDILIVDEVLAVGDAAFVSKCKERIAQLRRDGKTLILVTHDLDAVERWCDEALWLDSGEVKDRGDPRRVIDHYREFVERGEEAELLVAEEKRAAEECSVSTEQPSEAERSRWGSREIEITGVRLADAHKEHRLLFHPEEGFTVDIDYVTHEPCADVVFGIGINRSDGLVVHGSNTDIERVELNLPRRGTVSYVVKRLGLLDGNYSIDVAVHRADGYPYDYHKGAITFAVRWPQKQVGVVVPEHEWKVTGGAHVS